MIGHFRLANLMRFIPYPVTGGFVAGIGGAVCLAAMSLMGAKTGLAGDSRTAGASRFVEVEPGRGVWDRPVPRDETLGQPADSAGERRTCWWWVSSRARRPRHFGVQRLGRRACY